MGQALSASGRPIVLDVNDWTEDSPWIWARNLSNMWRTAPDIQDNYRSLVANFVILALLVRASAGPWERARG